MWQIWFLLLNKKTETDDWQVHGRTKKESLLTQDMNLSIRPLHTDTHLTAAALHKSYLLDDVCSSGMFQVHRNTLKSDKPSAETQHSHSHKTMRLNLSLLTRQARAKQEGWHVLLPTIITIRITSILHFYFFLNRASDFRRFPSFSAMVVCFSSFPY